MAHYNVSEVRLLITEREARGLHRAGAHSTEDLLQKGATPKDRAALAHAAGLGRATVDRLARRADMLRLNDVSPNQVLLLERVGVRSIADLGVRDATALALSIAAAQKVRKPDIAPVGEAQVRAWVTQAKALPRVLQD